jgi:Leucine-rich repeat (LRR) protein
MNVLRGLKGCEAGRNQLIDELTFKGAAMRIASRSLTCKLAEFLRHWNWQRTVRLPGHPGVAMRATMKRLALACFLIWVMVAPGQSQVEQAGIPTGTIAAWEGSGATFGWVWMDPEGNWRFDIEKPESPGPCAELLRCFEPVEVLPAFRFAKVASGDLLRLPHPALPFGLWLGFEQVNGFGTANDAVLEELAKAGFSQLQALIIGGQYTTAITDIGLNAMATLHSLRWLDPGDTSATTSGLLGLAKLSNLESLTLDDSFYNRVDGSIIKALATLPRLRSLAIRPLPELAALTQLQTLRTGWANAQTLKAIASLRQLRVLTIEFGFVNRGFGDAELNELAGLAELRSLKIQTNALSEAGMKTLSGFRLLERLDLKSTSVTAAGLRQLAGSSNLRALTFRRTLSDADLAELVPISRLEELHVRGFSDAGMKSVAAIKGLRSLDISDSAITDIGLKEMSALSGLQTLSLGDAQISDTGMEDIAGLQQLQWLNLAKNSAITDAGIGQLAGLSQLQTLSLRGANITGKRLGTLSRNLRVLDLSLTHVSDADLPTIAGFPRLRALELGGTNVSDVGLQSLAPMPQLRSLNLGSTRVTNAGLPVVKALTQLEILSLSSTAITDVTALMGMTRLQSVALPLYFFANLGRTEMEKLQRALPHAEIRAQAPR